MLQTNKDKLPRSSAVCRIKNMRTSARYETWKDADGFGHLAHGSGGINYDQQIGDSCMDMVGVLLCPGVSVEDLNSECQALQVYGCVGNEVIVTTGDAKGERGYYTGKVYDRGTHSHLYFPADVLEKLNGEEHFLVRCCGTGLRLTDYPQVEIMNIDPSLFEKLGIEEADGKLMLPVTHVLPSYIMGEGWGTLPFNGEIDISTDDEDCYRECGMKSLRYGDLVFIQDLDTTHGVSYLEHSATLGIIVHSDSTGLGLGPGVMPILSCKEDILRPVVNASANIAGYLGVERRE